METYGRSFSLGLGFSLEALVSPLVILATVISSKDKWIRAYSIGLNPLGKLSCPNKKKKCRSISGYKSVHSKISNFTHALNCALILINLNNTDGAGSCVKKLIVVLRTVAQVSMKISQHRSIKNMQQTTKFL